MFFLLASISMSQFCVQKTGCWIVNFFRIFLSYAKKYHKAMSDLSDTAAIYGNGCIGYTLYY